MTARQPKPTGAKQFRPLQILVYTPQSGGAKGTPQTSEVFDAGGSSKDGPGGSQTPKFTNGNGETLRIPEYITHTVRYPPSSIPRRAEGQYHRPVTTTPAVPIYPHHHHLYPDHPIHPCLSHQEPSLPLPPTPQQSSQFATTTMTIPPISEEEWTMLISPESPPEVSGLKLWSPAMPDEFLDTCPPVDGTGEGRQWWYELLCAEGDEQGFWTRFLGSDEGALGGEVSWAVSGVGEVQGGLGGLEDEPEG